MAEKILFILRTTGVPIRGFYLASRAIQILEGRILTGIRIFEGVYIFFRSQLEKWNL